MDERKRKFIVLGVLLFILLGMTMFLFVFPMLKQQRQEPEEKKVKTSVTTEEQPKTIEEKPKPPPAKPQVETKKYASISLVGGRTTVIPLESGRENPFIPIEPPKSPKPALPKPKPPKIEFPTVKLPPVKPPKIKIPKPPEILYQCPSCNRSFKTKRELDKHIRLAHPPPPPEPQMALQGIMWRKNEYIGILTVDNNNYVVKKGDVIEKDYRVIGIDTNNLLILNTSTKKRKILSIGP